MVMDGLTKIINIRDTDSVASNFHLGMTEGFISFMVRIPATNSFTSYSYATALQPIFLVLQVTLPKYCIINRFVIKQPVHKNMET